eukprot:528461_1
MSPRMTTSCAPIDSVTQNIMETIINNININKQIIPPNSPTTISIIMITKGHSENVTSINDNIILQMCVAEIWVYIYYRKLYLMIMKLLHILRY